MRKSKRDYYNNLNEKNICDNRKFSKVVEPLLPNKIISNNKITLVEWEGITQADQANAKVLNNFFSDLFVDFIFTNVNRGGSRTAATSKMEHFVIIVNGWKPLTIITKSSILDVAVVLDPPLVNDSITQSTFPSLVRLANIIPVHKKHSKTSKDH